MQFAGLRGRSFRRFVVPGMLALTSVISAASSRHPIPHPRQGRDALLVADVNVVDVGMGTIHEHSDILIADGKIAAIGPHGTIQPPRGALRLDQPGRFVIPGLIDMHAHLSAEDDAPRMLSYGITAARHMADVPWWTKTLMGFPDGRDLRDRIMRGELQGPDLLVAGLVLDGEPPISPLNQVVTDPAKARKIVAKQAADGYDFIKVYDHLSAPVFEAILAEAAKRRVLVAGHVPVAVGIDRGLTSTLMTIEHVTGYVDQHHVKLLIDEQRIQEYAERTKASGMVNCPTLVVWRNIPPRDSLKLLESQPEFRHLSWRIRWLWKTTLKYLDKKPYEGTDLGGDMTRLTVRMTRALYDAGAPIIAGTDMNFLGVYPGLSLHQEMEYLRDAGLTDLDALRAATINAAKALGLENAIGSVDVGKRANLVILNANPLADIRATREIRDVIKNGNRVPKRL